jgi:hypothetical protein
VISIYSLSPGIVELLENVLIKTSVEERQSLKWVYPSFNHGEPLLNQKETPPSFAPKAPPYTELDVT